MKILIQVALYRKKKKMKAICAVIRKILTGILAYLKSNIPFDSSKLFSEEHKKSCA